MRPGRIVILSAVAIALVAGAFILMGSGGVTVSVDADDGIGYVEGAGDYGPGEKVILKVGLKEGSFLTGWYDSGSNLLCTETSFEVEAEDVTYYVRTSSILSVSISKDFGVVSCSGDGVFSGTDTLQVSCGLKPGFQFRGWYDGDGNFLSMDMDASIPAKKFTKSDSTLCPRSFSDKKVVLQIADDPGIESTTGNGIHNLGEEVDVSAKLAPGYAFAGWYDSDGNLLGKSVNIRVYAEDRKIFPRTEHTPGIELELVGDKGIGGTSMEDDRRQGTMVSIGAELKPGYSFDGWYDEAGELVSVRIDTEFLAEKDTKLYARSVPGYTYHPLAMAGLNSPMKESFMPGDESVFYAEETSIGCFAGWYRLDGTLASESRFIDPADNDCVLLARSDIDAYGGDRTLTIRGYPDWYGEDSYCIVLDSRTKCLIDWFPYKEKRELSLKDGTYDVCFYNGLFDRAAEHEVVTETLGSSQEYEFRWKFEGVNYGASWEVPNAEFERYRDLDITHECGTEDAKALCDYDDPFVVEVADYLDSFPKQMDQRQKADFVLKFVQYSVRYQFDEDYNGHEEYAKHPTMTMLEGRGDCEDVAILYAALMKAIGYDVVLLEYVGEKYEGMEHMASAVRLDTILPGDTYYEYNGGKYVYCEATGDSDVGEGWDPYDEAGINPI